MLYYCYINKELYLFIFLVLSVIIFPAKTRRGEFPHLGSLEADCETEISMQYIC